MAEPGIPHAQPATLETLARLPALGDNVAIATRTLPAGQLIGHADRQFALDYAVLEGHRFAVQDISSGDPLLSWGLPFGLATRTIPAGAYVCNAAMLEALRGRPLPFELPGEPNFRDFAAPFVLDEANFRPGSQVPAYPQPRHFMGYVRGGARGVGTRNFIVLLGVTSRAAGYVRALEARLKQITAGYPNLDGVVAVAHTEGDGPEPLNNQDLLLRTLAGFMVHPNVGAVLAVDAGGGQITNAGLRAYMLEHAYPLEQVRHSFLSLSERFQADLERGAALAREWLPVVTASQRQLASLANLAVALQCGGSDAFSGISGNPLAAAVAREIVRYGGIANLAETTELMGAEPYLLQNVRDLDTARACLGYIERFKELMAWHGVTGEGNLSGGNRYRGLYNIVLKSIGAATKRHPQVRLDFAVDYAERMQRAGFYFMNSPGNDLESLAGQVAGGSTMIIFTTGNGSITNFPFVPTIKVMTTSARYHLLSREMDVNAGAFLDGAPLDDLTRETLDLTVNVASGARSKGELAGHSQVSVWRNWRQTGPGRVSQLLDSPEPDGRRLPIRTDDPVRAAFRFPVIRVGSRLVTDQIGLILPASLCAGQIARLAAARLDRLGLGYDQGLSRYVALVHSEGCGVAGHSTGALYQRTLLNYMAHPLVRLGLFLEHGCEKTHNAFLRRQLEQSGGDPSSFGWASVQLDGGIEAALAKIEAWFRQALARVETPAPETASLEALKLGLHSAGRVPPSVGAALAQVTRTVVGAGGTVVVPQSATLLESDEYVTGTLQAPAMPSLAYGQAAGENGFHLMASPSAHWVETLTGLGATGVELLLVYPGAERAPGHPLLPMLQIAPGAWEPATDDFSVVLEAEPGSWAGQLLQRVVETAGQRHGPGLFELGDVDFQITRGLLGVTV